MAFLFVALLICGLLLGTSFTAYILIPASLASVAAAFAVTGIHGITALEVLLALFIGPLIIQAGYCVGHLRRPCLIDAKPAAFLGFGVL